MNEASHNTDEELFDVCIIGLKCWGAISGSRNLRFIGGIETDLVTLARMLAQSGKKVALITYDEGQGAINNIDGVAVYASFSPDDGLPGLRFLFPRASGLVRTIRTVPARFFVQMGAGVEAGWTGIACKLSPHNPRFVFLAGGDRDCMKDLPALPRLRERVLYRIALRLADRIVTQTDSQAELLAKSFDKPSDVLRLPNVLAGAGEYKKTATTALQNLRVLWVGRLDRNKRPDRLLDLARTYPDYRFDVVGEANSSDVYAHEFKAAAQEMGNIHLHGRLRQEDLVPFYANADFLCCTSEVEGFPATFLEAWSLGVPTISTFDPGGIINSYEAGIGVASERELREALKFDNVMSRRAEWAANAADLYIREYSPEASINKFNQVLEKVA